MGLDNKRKVNLVKIYLGANKSIIIFTEAKQAVSKVYIWFGKPSLLNQLHSPPFSPLSILVQSELIVLYKPLRSHYLHPSEAIFFTNQITAAQMDEIKIIDYYFIRAFIIIIVARKVTTLLVAPGQLLVKHNVRQIEGLLMNYKEVTNNIFMDQVPYWDP